MTFDAVCKCGAKFQFTGPTADHRPACPVRGKKPALAATEAEAVDARIRRKFREKKPK